MPAETFKLILDKSEFSTALKESEAQAASSTSAISASLQKVGDGGEKAGQGIHLLNDKIKMSRQEVREANGTIALLGDTIGLHIPRHCRTLISQLSFVGPALNAAFNAVAVITIAKALYELGEKVYEFFKKSSEASEKAEASARELEGSLNKANMELDLSNDKLEQQIAKLEKKPYNGLQLALDQASLSSVNLAQKLDAAIQKERELLQARDAGALARFAGTEGTSSAQGTLNKYNDDQNQIDIKYQKERDAAVEQKKTVSEINDIERRHLEEKANA